MAIIYRINRGGYKKYREKDIIKNKEYKNEGLSSITSYIAPTTAPCKCL